MIRKWLRSVLLVAASLVMVVALTPTLQRWLDQHGYIPNQYGYGDLYNLTNLPAFKELDYTANADLTEAEKPVRHFQDVDLYTIGDSFTNIDTSFYPGSRNAHIWVGAQPAVRVSLTSGKKNILVIEVIERVLQERMYWPDYNDMYIKGGFVPQSGTALTSAVTTANKEEKTSVVNQWLALRFGKEINQRLEFLLFNGRLATWIKESKAQLMFTLFKRVTGAVISKDEKHLFYPFEVDTTYELSAFRKLTDQRVDTLVGNLNTIRRNYLSMGFNEVYFCLIPNKVTILDPTYGTYNNQIARIEANPHFEAPFISTIDSLRQHPEWYHLGDGHWNRNGKLFWLRQVDRVAASWSEKH